MEWLLPSWEIRWIYETHNISATLQTLVCIVCSLQECVLYCTCTCNKDWVYVLLCSVPFSLNWDMVVLSAVTPFREEIFLSPRSRPFIISKQHSYSPQPQPQQSSVQKACFPFGGSQIMFLYCSNGPLPNHQSQLSRRRCVQTVCLMWTARRAVHIRPIVCLERSPGSLIM